jgi:V8-like Glu-specific endopeptidase
MKAILYLLLLSVTAQAQIPVLKIYGDDNRKEVSRATGMEKALADASAALIPNSYMIKGATKFILDAPTLEQSDLVCDSERYRSQPAASICSGTLIAPDLILTASHCYNTNSLCQQASWIFGYHESKSNRYEFKKKEVYGCKEIVYRAFDIEKGQDFAIIKLDRKVKNHKPVSIRPSGDPLLNTKLILVGHPRGLPTKIADDAWITEIKENILMTNVDAYTGNSGSGVFNADSGFLEGVLSFGKEDYEENKERTCVTSQVYRMQDGGEAVMKIDPVREFLKNYQSIR